MAITRMRLFETGAPERKSPAGRPGHDFHFSRASAPRLPGGLLFSALFAAALAQPTNERSDHERGQQERGDYSDG
jgi:hypothetical protein